MIHTIVVIVIFIVTLIFMHFARKLFSVALVNNTRYRENVEHLNKIINIIRKSIEDNDELEMIDKNKIADNATSILNRIISISENSEYISQEEKDCCKHFYNMDTSSLSEETTKYFIELILF